MEFKEMVLVLKQVNEKSKNPVDLQLLEQILALVMKNPLDSDRGMCQDQIMTLLKQKGGDWDYNSKNWTTGFP